MKHNRVIQEKLGSFLVSVLCVQTAQQGGAASIDLEIGMADNVQIPPALLKIYIPIKEFSKIHSYKVIGKINEESLQHIAEKVLERIVFHAANGIDSLCLKTQKEEVTLCQYKDAGLEHDFPLVTYQRIEIVSCQKIIQSDNTVYHIIDLSEGDS